MIPANANSLTDWEAEMARYFASDAAMQCKSMEELLCRFYFRQQDGRAMIIQARDHYCVLFLSPDKYDDPVQKKQEIDRFFALMRFVRDLKTAGYLAVYRGMVSYGKLMHFLQDDFKQVQPNNTRMVLNEKGDFTAAPDTIHDKNGVVIYKGIIFDADYFQMICNCVTGQVYIFPGIQQIVQAQPVITISGDQSAPDPDPPPQQHSRKRSLLFTAMILLLVLGITTVILLFQSLGHTAQIKNHVDAVLAGGIVSSDTNQHTPDSADAMIPVEVAATYYGVDISHWDGDVMREIQSVDSLTFAICKATEGATGIDPDFKDNWQLIRDARLIRGAYHFFRITSDPVKQATHFYNVISQAGFDSTDMPPVIDIEALSLTRNTALQKAQLQQALFACLRHIEQLSGRIPMVYTDYSFANTYLTDTGFARYPLWLADYSDNRQPRIPIAWKNTGYHIWQRSDTVRMGRSMLDFDVFYGRKADLMR